MPTVASSVRDKSCADGRIRPGHDGEARTVGSVPSGTICLLLTIRGNPSRELSGTGGQLPHFGRNDRETGHDRETGNDRRTGRTEAAGSIYQVRRRTGATHHLLPVWIATRLTGGCWRSLAVGRCRG